MVSWSFQIARIRGIPLKAHVSFLLVLPLLALLFSAQVRGAAQATQVPPGQLEGGSLLWGLLVALGLFLSVLLHELAHAFYALSHGGRVSSITLMMIGGVTRLEEAPRRPRHEAMMALVGPLTSIALGLLCFALFVLLRGSTLFHLQLGLAMLAWLNVVLGLFNLLPAFPMDGGRILRALLIPRLGLLQATRTAALVGKGFAVLFGLVGLTTNPLLLLIAFFVFLGADAESRQVVLRQTLEPLRVHQLMTPRTRSLQASDSLEQALARLEQERQLALPVSEGERVVGVLSLQRVRRASAQERQGAFVSALMQPLTPLPAEEQAWSAVQRLGAERLPLLPVVHGGRLVGTVGEEDILRALAMSELRRPAQRRREVPT
jgi:Zn-dependent protease/CBS domain-containing protein